MVRKHRRSKNLAKSGITEADIETNGITKIPARFESSESPETNKREAQDCMGNENGIEQEKKKTSNDFILDDKTRSRNTNRRTNTIEKSELRRLAAVNPSESDTAQAQIVISTVGKTMADLVPEDNEAGREKNSKAARKQKARPTTTAQKDGGVKSVKDFAATPATTKNVELEKVDGSGSSEGTVSENDKMHHQRIAFFEKNFPSLFSDDWLSSPELLSFLEQEKAFTPPPQPVFDPDAEKKGLVPVTDRKQSTTQEHYELGRIGNMFVRRIPKKKTLVEVPTSKILRTRAAGENQAKFLEEHRHKYYMFITAFYLAAYWQWDPYLIGRFDFLSNPYKIARILKSLECTVDDYIEVFGLKYTTRDDYMTSGYMPFYLAARCVLIHPNPVYRRMWRKITGKEAMDCVNTPKVIQWHPSRVLSVLGPERLKMNEKNFEEIVWQSVRQFEEREDYISSDPDTDSDEELVCKDY